MVTIREALEGVTGYPIPAITIETIVIRRGLELDMETSYSLLQSREYKLAEADLLMWLSRSPNISQGGQSYSLSDEQRKEFRRRAVALYSEAGETGADIGGIMYGYKGENL